MKQRPGYRIEAATSREDLDATIALLRSYATSLAVDLAYQDFETELATLPGKYAPPTGALRLARSMAGTPIGCVALRSVPPDGSCEMKRLYVSSEARGLGLGAALVGAIIDDAIRIGYTDDDGRDVTLPKTRFHGNAGLLRHTDPGHALLSSRVAEAVTSSTLTTSEAPHFPRGDRSPCGG